MEQQPLRIAIAGTGDISNTHALGVLAEPTRMRLAAVCDVDAGAVAAFARRYKVPRHTTDYRAILDDPDVDAVILPLPHHLHADMSVAALEAGKHVLVEKPIARTLDEADRMIAAAQRANRVLMVAHNQRYYPVHRRIHELLAKDAVGDILCARTDHIQNFARPEGHWLRSKDAVGGGCVVASGVHRLDLLRWYLGEADEVFAWGRTDPGRIEGESLALAAIRFRSGTIAELVCNWALGHSWGYQRGNPCGERMTLFGRHGTISVDNKVGSIVRDIDGAAVEASILSKESRYESMWAHFAHCIRTGAEPLTSAPDGCKTLELALAISRSIDTGQPVKLPPGR